LPNTVKRLLLQTLPGRLFLLSAIPLALLLLLQQFTQLPAFLEMLRRVVALGLIVALVGFAAIGIARGRRRLLWRVRRKLILSYVLLGVIPVVLVGAFMLVASFVLYTIIVAYAFHEGFDDVAAEVAQTAHTVAADLARGSRLPQDSVDRRYETLRERYPDLSLAVLPARTGQAGATGSAAGRPGPVVRAGRWRHAPPPETVPAWVARPGGFSGVLALTGGGGNDPHLLIRSVVPSRDGTMLVVADLPVESDLMARIEEETGTRLAAISLPENATPIAGVVMPSQGSAAAAFTSGTFSLFRQSVAFMDFISDWETGSTGRVSITLVAPLHRIVERLAEPSAFVARFLALSLLALGLLLLVIQGSAFFMGGLLVRSITSAVHELFAGTERVMQGDFAHRIRIDSEDQLGDLAESFNRMGASIEHLLHVQREKQRLDDELRIAREIQKSLLPVNLPNVAGLTIADLCEPAREVGGDYYDLFELGPGRLGVLVADVAGKGTSAALYMAELKGLMLALSHAEASPRRLLMDVNRHLVNHLDNRSFITMTYAVIDVGAGTMTCARAGHTPLIVVSGGQSSVIAPSGMVVGLRIPGAETRFDELLVDHTTPIGPGDVIVLYTDGITEAMDPAGELFGDAALARVLSTHHRLDPGGIRERVLREVRAFVGDAEPHDDMTMIVLKVGESGPG
jgi:sigma-B regulation protein RsbU (phosphoserine phosphatase)